MIIAEQIGAEIALIKLNRPDKRNALNVELLQKLCDQIERFQQKRVLIVCGADPVFCAGMDIKEKADKGDLIAKLFRLLYTSPLITIAAVQGAVLAGGLGLMAACDLVVAHPKTLFGLPELQRGLVPAQVLTLLLRQIPLHAVKELLFLENMNAPRALSIGLINKLSEHPLETALEWAQQALKGAPAATKLAKQLTLDPAFSEQLEKALEWHHKMLSSDEAQRGIEKFFHKEE